MGKSNSGALLDSSLRAVRAEIDLSCIDHNIKEIKRLVGTTPIIGVVKADGYGHGAVEVSKVLLKNGVETLGVATISEAIELREAGIDVPVVILGPAPEGAAGAVIDYGFTPVITNFRDAEVLSNELVRRELAAGGRIESFQGEGKTVEVLIALETGMGRVGFFPDEKSFEGIVKIMGLPGINIKGLFSHFATADEKDKTYARQQISMFEHWTEVLGELGVPTCFRTHANSAAVMELPEANFDAVRPGIIIYGCYPSNEVDKSIIDLKPAMSLKANISFIKTVPAGTSISYGRKFTTERVSIIATLPLGYADGYPRFLSGKGRVLVKGRFAPVVGNICMDQCMIDVTDIPGVELGDEVVLIGRQGENEILADEVAEKTGTINYEIVCRIGKRVPRVYVGG